MAAIRRPLDDGHSAGDLESGAAPAKTTAGKGSRIGVYRWLDTLYNTWGMDTRSLAFYRICLAGVIVCDIFDRITNLREHYSDDGYVPRRLAITAWELPSQICIHMANGTTAYQGFLFLLQFIWAMALAVGYRTRLATLLCWYWNISLEMKNPIILHNGDVYLRMMLFWAIFLPLGDQWSLDRIRAGRSLPEAANVTPAPESYRHLSWGGSVGSILQLHYVYTVSVLHKYEAGYKIWFQEGSATYWAVKSLPYYWTMIGEWVATSVDPFILRVLTYAVLAFEFFGPFFLVSPWKTHYCRLFAIAGIASLHLGFASCLKLEEFVWIGCTASFCCLPAWIWDVWIPRIRARASSAPREIKVVYSDRYLPLAQTVETFFLLSNVHWVTEEADTDAPRNGFTVTVDGQAFTGPAALVVLFSYSPVLWPLGRLFLVGLFPAALRGLFWAISVGMCESEEASTRRSKRWRISPEVREFLSYMFSPKIWLNVLGFFFMLYSYMWVGSNVGIAYMPSSLRVIAHPLMLYQSWQMFAPPPQHAYWHNIELRLKGGDHLELIKGGGLWRWEGVPWHDGPPEPMYPNYGNHRNWKWWETFNWHSDNTDVRLEFGRWVCREWNARHAGDKTLIKHKIHYAYYPADTPKDQIMQKAIRAEMWDHSCF